MATERTDPSSSKRQDVSKAKPKKSKLRLKRVFKRKKKEQRKEKQFKEMTPSSDPCPNLSPGATTSQNVQKSKSNAKVQGYQATSTEEPAQDNLRKLKQEPFIEDGKQEQEAETSSIESTGVDIIDISYVTSSTTGTSPPAMVGAKEEPAKVSDSTVDTPRKKPERHKKKHKWFVVRFRKKTKETKNDSDAPKDTCEKPQIELMTEEEKRKELLQHGTTVLDLGPNTEKKNRGLKTPWKKAKRKREEKDTSSESDGTEGKLSDIQDDRPRRKKWKRKWPRLLKKEPKKKDSVQKSDSVPEAEVAVTNEQPKQTLEDLQREVTETQEIVRDIVEKKLAQRDENLRDLARAAEDLEKAAGQFAKVSKKVRFKMWLRNRKWTICTISAVGILLSVGAVVLCVIFV